MIPYQSVKQIGFIKESGIDALASMFLDAFHHLYWHISRIIMLSKVQKVWSRM